MASSFLYKPKPRLGYTGAPSTSPTRGTSPCCPRLGRSATWCWTRAWTPPLRASQSLLLLQYTLQRKFETNIPSKEIARPQSQKFMSLWANSHDRSAYSAAGKSLFLVQYTLQRKFETNIPSTEIARPLSCVCERIRKIDLPILLQESHLFLYSTLQRTENFRNKYSHKRNFARPQSQFPHSCGSVSDLYIPTIALPNLLQEICIDRSWEYINRSLTTHECGNWVWGRGQKRNT